MSATEDITAHVQKSGGAYSRWYVGIATKPKERLFNDHAVDEAKGHWIFRPCGSSSEARKIEKYFIGQGMKGGDGGGDEATKTVYAYRITTSTRE